MKILACLVVGIALLAILLGMLIPDAALEGSASQTCSVPADHATIQAAVSDENCSQVIVDDDTYYERVTITRTLTIIGQGPDRSTINGFAGGSVFFIDGSQGAINVTLEGLNIVNGSSNAGGGLYNIGATVTLTDTRLAENWASSQGGGIYTKSGKLTVANSSLTDNEAGNGSGGGIYIDSGTAILQKSIIDDNVGGYHGGGLYNREGNVTLEKVTVAYNSTRVDGAGVFNHHTLTVDSSSIHDNETRNYGGGGIRNEGTLYVNNSTISDNKAAWNGGIDNWYGVLRMSSSTVANNTARTESGGVNSHQSNVRIQNSIVSSNSPNDCTDRILSDGFNIIGDVSDCDFQDVSGDQVGIAANLGPLEGEPGYLPLLTGPGIDAGNPIGCIDHTGNPLLFDQRGLPRFGRCDIGAYELQPLEYSTKSVTPQRVNPLDPATYTVVLHNDGDSNIPGVQLTDTLPISLTYHPGSLAASSGDYEYENGVITWTGAITASEKVTITYMVTVGEEFGLIPNTAVVNGGGLYVSLHALLEVGPLQTYLPWVAIDYCPDFFDDFSNPNSGWPVGEHELYTYGYLSGEYQIRSKKAGYVYMFESPSCRRENYGVEVDARWVGAPGSGHGILFGIVGDYDRYYLFDVNTDYQMYRLYYRSPSGWETLVSPTTSNAINYGNATNHLKVIRNGTEIRLVANGTTLSVLNDHRITGLTGAGIVSEPYDDRSSSDARFNNFSMVQLSDSDGTALKSKSAAEPHSLRANRNSYAASTRVLDWESYFEE